MHESLLPMLKKIGIEGDYCPQISKSEIKTKLPNYEGLVVRSKVFVDQDLIKNCHRLKVVCRAGAGIDNLDVGYLIERNIKIINAPEGNRNAVAEHCLGLVFSLLNNIVKSHIEISKYKWDREENRGAEIGNKTIGILGYGFMGSAVAEKFSKLGCRVIAYDKYKSDFTDEWVEEVSLEKLYKETDILSIHVPLTAETSMMVSDHFINQFNKNIWLVNTSRGEIVRLTHLIDNIATGKIKAAALDVLENEKIERLNEDEHEVFKKLISFDQVILTPHIAGWTYESYEKINMVLVKKLKNFLQV